MRKKIPFSILTLLITALIGGIIYAYTVLHEEVSPGYGHLILHDRHGVLITDIGGEVGYARSYTGNLDIPFFRALVSVEDRRFYSHLGIDSLGKGGIIFRSLMQGGGNIRGGSTITEQYIKNHFFRGQSRTLTQKIKEALLALAISLTEDKNTILRKYADSVYFGNGIYGISVASEVYFAKTPDRLDEGEIADLLSLVKEPNTSTIPAYRTNVVRKLGLPVAPPSSLPIKKRYTYRNNFPLLTERIQRERDLYCSGKPNSLSDFVMNRGDSLCSSETEILLSLDMSLQQESEKILKNTLAPLAKNNLNNAAVLVYDREDKKFLAYIGNISNNRDKAIDMVTRNRSVGSILKPFIYLLALNRGAESQSLILDENIAYPTGREKETFTPINYIAKSYGPITLANSLGNSLNSATVRLIDSLGLETVYTYLRNSGIELPEDVSYYGYGIGIGGVETSLENIVKSYANLWEPSDSNKYILEHILKDSKYRSMTFGASSILNTSIPLAVKTGTSTDFRDNWTVSYNKNIVLGVWVGNTDGSEMREVSGVTGAGPVWHGIAEYLIQKGYIRDAKDSLPLGVRELYICKNPSCSRKEFSLRKSTELPASFPDERIFRKKDFIHTLTEEELKKWNIGI